MGHDPEGRWGGGATGSDKFERDWCTCNLNPPVVDDRGAVGVCAWAPTGGPWLHVSLASLEVLRLVCALELVGAELMLLRKRGLLWPQAVCRFVAGSTTAVSVISQTHAAAATFHMWECRTLMMSPSKKSQDPA